MKKWLFVIVFATIYPIRAVYLIVFSKIWNFRKNKVLLISANQKI